MKFLMIGIGGGIGAILRYLISAVPMKVSFPVQTFVTNVLGAILIGGWKAGFTELEFILESGNLWRIYDIFYIFAGNV